MGYPYCRTGVLVGLSVNPLGDDLRPELVHVRPAVRPVALLALVSLPCLVEVLDLLASRLVLRGRAGARPRGVGQLVRDGVLDGPVGEVLVASGGLHLDAHAVEAAGRHEKDEVGHSRDEPLALEDEQRHKAGGRQGGHERPLNDPPSHIQSSSLIGFATRLCF